MGKFFDEINEMIGFKKSTKEEEVRETEETTETSETDEENINENISTNKSNELNEQDELVEDGFDSDDISDFDGLSENVIVDDKEKKVELKDEDDSEDELTYTKEQNKALLERISLLESQDKIVESVKSVEPEPEPETKINFFSDEDDIDEILGDKEKLNEFAIRIYNKALNDSKTATSDSFVNSLPETITNQVKNYLMLERGIDEFFTLNEDLLPVRGTVGAVTNEIIAEHKDWGLKQVLEEAGKKTREILKIKRKTKTVRERNPALVNSRSSRKTKGDTRSNIQKDIDDLIN